MRNFLNFALLVLPIMPFSFWKMEGPFCIKTYPGDPPYNSKSSSNSNQYIIDSVTLINKSGQNEYIFESAPDKTHGINYLLNYNYNIGYSIVYNYAPYILAAETKDFVRQAFGTLSGYGDFTNPSISFYVVRENFGRNINNLKKGEFNILEKAIGNKDTQRIKIQQEFTSSSGVTISNREDKVEIKSARKTVNFQEALLQYFISRNKNSTSNTIANSSRRNIEDDFNIIGRPAPPIRAVNQGLQNFNTIMGNQELLRLQNSTILTVYGVLKGPLNQDSIIWGLAEDKKTEKIFQWITDLQADISVLIN